MDLQVGVNPSGLNQSQIPEQWLFLAAGDALLLFSVGSATLCKRVFIRFLNAVDIPKIWSEAVLGVNFDWFIKCTKLNQALF